ncbi:MAG: TIGR00180 family glycosyltransferase [Candidatus Omnitrophica bacterium]|nr:TIGR00180 family glycosyltransferase [Candidatus Omnitrophota bacterium]MDD5429922.1 TIGR00180 family glycosyltransferase [Candidatus Omnitrophota bacterium]
MISIVIPTKNRSDFLIRLLNYYYDLDYKHWICIGDSSDSSHAERIKKEIDRLKHKLKITYRQYPGLNDLACYRELIDSVKTPYIVYIADDDFLIPRGLEACIEFLESNKDYTAANGEAFVFSLKDSGPKGEISSLSRYKQKCLEADKAGQRLIAYLEDYFVTLFSVQKTGVWKTMYKDVLSISNRQFAGELLPACLSAVEGKIKHLGCLYLARQVHDLRYCVSDVYDWLVAPDFGSSYETFSGILIKAIMEKDNLRQEKASQMVKQAFWRHLSIVIPGKYKYCYGRNSTNVFTKLKDNLKSVSFMPKAINNIKSILYPSGNLSLLRLLSKQSRYHNDFMPIHKAITGFENKGDA